MSKRKHTETIVSWFVQSKEEGDEFILGRDGPFREREYAEDFRDRNNRIYEDGPLEDRWCPFRIIKCTRTVTTVLEEED